jgi:hypothetical protein
MSRQVVFTLLDFYLVVPGCGPPLRTDLLVKANMPVRWAPPR